MNTRSKLLLKLLLALLPGVLHAQTGSIDSAALPRPSPWTWVEFRGLLCILGQTYHGENTSLYCGTPDLGLHIVYTLPEEGGAAEGLVVLNNLMYFNIKKPGVVPTGLPQLLTDVYVSDGTTEGTRAFIGFPTDTDSFKPWNALVVGRKLYYMYDTGVRKPELWVSDGSASGSHLLKQFRNPTSGKIPNFFSYNGKIFFEASDTGISNKLWMIDTTTEAVNLLFDFKLPQDMVDPYIGDFTTVNNRLYFKATDFITPNVNKRPRLWVTDGTSKGTHVVTSLANEVDYGLAGMGANAAGNRLYFQTGDGTEVKLWFTDGAGVVPVQSFPSGRAMLLPNPPNSAPPNSPERMFFLYSDPAEDVPVNNTQKEWKWVLWSTDGSPDGTVPTSVHAQTALSLGRFVVIIDHHQTLAYSRLGVTPLTACNGAQDFASSVKVFDSLYFAITDPSYSWRVCRVH